MPVISSGVAAAQKNRKKKKVDNSDEHAWIAAFRAETRKLGICESDDEWESDSDDEYDIDAGIAATLSRDDGDRKSSMAVHKYLNQQGRGPTCVLLPNAARAARHEAPPRPPNSAAPTRRCWKVLMARPWPPIQRLRRPAPAPAHHGCRGAPW